MDLIDLLNVFPSKTEFSLFDKDDNYICHGKSGEGMVSDYIYCNVFTARAEGYDEVFVWLNINE